jgi:hypothetical protein
LKQHKFLCYKTFSTQNLPLCNTKISTRIYLNTLASSGSLYRKVILPNFFDRTLFDRNTIWPNTVWPNTIWPKGHLTETPFDRTLFDRMPFDRNTIWPNRRLTERCLTESSFYRKVIWLKIKFIKRSFYRKYLEKGHLTENQIWKTSQMTEMTFDRKFIWPKAFFEIWSFDRKLIWPKALSKNGHLTTRSFDRIFF